jgi:hypothetical protein
MKKSLLMGLVVSLMCVASASAEITIVDPSFENHNPPGTNTALVFPWTSENDGAFGWVSTEGKNGFHNIPDGVNAASPSDDHIWQDLAATYVEGVTYTLSALASSRGSDAQGGLDAWEIALADPSGTYLASTIGAFDLIASDVGPEAWQPISVTYTATAADAGKNIRIAFATGQGPVVNTQDWLFIFDDVHLNTSVPVEIVQTEGTTLVREENETTDSFTIALTEEPNVPVTVTLDPTTADVSLNAEEPNDAITLTFGTDDWDTPQAVTVKANDDDEAEGQEVITVGISLASDNPYFTGGTSLSVTVVDNDSASVVIEQSDGSTAVIEGGATDSYTVVLGFVPNSDVTITIDDSGDPNQTTVDGGETTALTFTPANWDTPQTVTVEAIDDDDPEANPHNTALTHTVSQPGGDNAYDGLSVSNVSVSVGEDDCGAGPFSSMDSDENCIVDLEDLAAFAGQYLTCSIAVCE